MMGQDGGIMFGAPMTLTTDRSIVRLGTVSFLGTNHDSEGRSTRANRGDVLRACRSPGALQQAITGSMGRG
jgi:hypothetical protein